MRPAGTRPSLVKGLPWLVFAAIELQGATLGLSDDEAYYWVLAQRPALGYAFHPPAVALVIAAAQKLFGSFLGSHCAGLVRLPAAICGAALCALGLRWIGLCLREDSSGFSAEAQMRASLGLLGFAGIWALIWMIVPDVPMFLGWTLAFVATWEICFAEKDHASKRVVLFLGIALAILSKYSGVLAVVSAGTAIVLWAPKERKARAMGALILGVVTGIVPILWWNSQHQWGSLLYQLRDRQGGSLSFVRYLRFWAIEAVLAGPALFAYAVLGVVKKFGRSVQLSRSSDYIWIWALPGAAVFCLQPLWADFKPHWALVVWWPLALGFALDQARGAVGRTWIRVHVGYGMGLTCLVWLSCHLPLGSWVGLSRPELDVTNDLYGWRTLREFVERSLGQEALRSPFVGSRYQTASQAAFALGEGARVTLLPRDLKALDEWPDLGVSDGQGPAWPTLRQKIYYVSDNRYDAPPEFPEANCTHVISFEKKRLGALAKTIFLWKCEPRSAQL